jgi:hypothetical protein
MWPTNTTIVFRSSQLHEGHFLTTFGRHGQGLGNLGAGPMELLSCGSGVPTAKSSN